MSANEVWCTIGRHVTYRHRELKEQYPGGIVCMGCQVKMMSELEKVVYMPEFSEAMHRRARKQWESSRREALEMARVKRANPDAAGLVYYIRINEQIKIGYTTNLKQRSRSYPPGSELLAVEPADPDLERYRHQQFKRQLVRGREWFTPSVALMEHIDQMRTEHGLPESLMYQFTKHRPKETADA
jgi:hypothetical protein